MCTLTDLQFVEFFGKFYEGGGRPFNPFKENTKYTESKGGNFSMIYLSCKLGIVYALLGAAGLPYCFSQLLGSAIRLWGVQGQAGLPEM